MKTSVGCGSVIFGTDPDPRIRTADLRTGSCPAFFFSGFQDVNENHQKVISQKEVTKQYKSRFFLLQSLDDGMIWEITYEFYRSGSTIVENTMNIITKLKGQTVKQETSFF
jgi:hypothetical protein